MGRIILAGIALVLGLIFIPPLLEGGTGNARDKGGSAAGGLVDTVKDPDAVMDGAGKVVDPVVEVATPWWQMLVSQPWFWTAVVCGAVAFAARRAWAGMNQGARMFAVGGLVFIFMFVVIATEV